MARKPSVVMGRHATGSTVDTLTDLFVAGFNAFATPSNTPPLQLPKRRLLRSIAVPVQVLPANDTVHDSTKAIRRMASVLPGWRHRLWPNSSHALFAQHPEEINDCVRHFAAEHRRSTP